MFEDIRTYADLAPDDGILEIGSGTGRATKALATWGNPVLGIEPAPAMADLARSNLAAYPHVEIRTVRFEDAQLEAGTFGLVTCAQVYHWLDAETRVQRIADALYAYGTAAIIANVQVNPEDNLPFWVQVQDVYRKYTPGMEHPGDFREPDNLPEHALKGSDLFTDHQQIGHPWQWTLSTSDYLGLCATHSNKAALDADTRNRLLTGIGELIDSEFDGHVTEHYVALVDLAHKP